MRWLVALAVPAVVLLSSCGGGEAQVSDKESAQFIDLARDKVPSAQAYDDDALKNMATNVCQVLKPEGTTVADADNVLDNYSKLSKADRAMITGLAVGAACPELKAKVPGS